MHFFSHFIGVVIVPAMSHSHHTVFSRQSVDYLCFSASMGGDAEFCALVMRYEEGLFLHVLIEALPDLLGPGMEVSSARVSLLLTTFFSRYNHQELPYDNERLSSLDWIIRLWKDRVLRCVSVLKHTYNAFIHFNSKDLLVIQDQLELSDTLLRLFTFFLLASVIFDEGALAYIQASDYFKLPGLINLSNVYIVKLIQDKYATRLLSGGLLYPGDHSVMREYQTIADNVEADLSEANKSRVNPLYLLIMAIKLQLTLVNIVKAMRICHKKKVNNPWMWLCLMCGPLPIELALSEYHQQVGQQSAEVSYKKLHDSVFKHYSAKAIKQHQQGGASVYLSLMKAFDCPLGDAHYPTFSEEVLKLEEGKSSQQKNGTEIITPMRARP